MKLSKNGRKYQSFGGSLISRQAANDPRKGKYRGTGRYYPRHQRQMMAAKRKFPAEDRMIP